MASTNTPVTLTFEVWSDLPSMRREAVITLTFSFVEDEGATFQRAFDVTVAPSLKARLGGNRREEEVVHPVARAWRQACLIATDGMVTTPVGR